MHDKHPIGRTSSVEDPTSKNTNLPGPIIEPLQKLGAAWLVSVPLMIFYIGTAALSVKHEHLLVSGEMRVAPFTELEVPVLGFFVLAPLIVVVLHVLSMLQALLMLRGHFSALSRYTTDRDSPTGELRLHWYTLRLLIVVFLVLLPMAVLALLQARFLPYHSFGVTLFQQLLTTVDIAACLLLVPSVLAMGRPWHTWWSRWGDAHGGLRFRLTRGAFAFVLSLSAAFTWLVATVPGTLWESLLGRRLLLSDRIIQRDLSLAGIQLVAEGTICSPMNPTFNLSGRDLRGADLSHARLRGVDLRGSNLEGARLVRADLSCADLSLLSAGGSGDYIHPSPEESRGLQAHTILRKADLTGASLQSAYLHYADLRGADLSYADAKGVQGTRTDLRSAILRKAQLQVSTFFLARFDGAVLEDSDAFCARFGDVSFQGLQARGLSAVGAEILGSDIRAANLADADLSLANFTGSRLTGSDLRGSTLVLAEGLVFRAFDLRQDELGDTSNADRTQYGPLGRGVNKRSFDAKLEAMVERLFSRVGTDLDYHQPSADQLKNCRIRINALPVESIDGHTSYHLREGASVRVGYDEEREVQDICGAVLREACDEFPIAAALVLRSSECVSPRDPVLESCLGSELAEIQGTCPAVIKALAIRDSHSPSPAGDPKSVNLFGSNRHESSLVGPPVRFCDALSRVLREHIAAVQ